MDKFYGYFFVTIVLTSLQNYGICLENVASGKLASQSGSHFTYSTAGKAVDGDTNPSMDGRSCAHPNTRILYGEQSNEPAWWKVDLGTSYDVYEIMIVNRDQLKGRLSETWVTVSDQENAAPNSYSICNEIVNGGEDVVKLICNYNNRNPPIRGRYVTIRRKSNANERYLLNFCEVEVLSCPPGSWGYDLPNKRDCSNFCDFCKDRTETCRVSDGYCFSGCADGLWGHYCNKQCVCVDDQACDRSTGNGCQLATILSTTSTKTTTVEAEVISTEMIEKDTSHPGAAPSESQDEIDMALIAGVVVAVVVLIVLVIIVIILIIRYFNYKYRTIQSRITTIAMTGSATRLWL